MDMSAINWLAVIVAAIIPFLIGFVWYGPLFGKPWMTSVGLTEEQVNKANMPKVLGISFVAQLIMAFFLAMFFYGDPAGAAAMTGSAGAFYGFLTGFGWVSMAICVVAQFEQKSVNYILMNSGYWIVVFTLMGLILGMWK